MENKSNHFNLNLNNFSIQGQFIVAVRDYLGQPFDLFQVGNLWNINEHLTERKHSI